MKMINGNTVSPGHIDGSKIPGHLLAKQWAHELHGIVQHARDKGEYPKVASAGARAGACMCCTVYCAPCFLWSTLWRLLCCPCQCVARGPMYMISDNGCTKCSDSCISVAATTIDAQRVMPPLAVAPNVMTADEKAAVRAVLEELLALFADESINIDVKKVVARRRLQSKLAENCMRPVYDLAGGSAVLGFRFEFMRPADCRAAIMEAMKRVTVTE